MFKLDDKQQANLDEWLDAQYAPLVAKQEQDSEVAQFITTVGGKKQPYLGAAIGGGLTYQFTPTSLGMVTKVVFCKGTDLEATVDLTDYNDW
jgi:hypothetical protein